MSKLEVLALREVRLVDFSHEVFRPPLFLPIDHHPVTGKNIHRKRDIAFDRQPDAFFIDIGRMFDAVDAGQDGVSVRLRSVRMCGYANAGGMADFHNGSNLLGCHLRLAGLFAM